MTSATQSAKSVAKPKRTAAIKTRVKKIVLPLGQMPKGRGWEISTGNLDVNVWVRK